MSSFRKLALTLFLFSAALLAGAYWLEHVMLYIPCSLCILQRAVFWAIAAIFLVGFIFHPKKGQVLLVSFSILFALMGVALTARQIYIMHLPPEAVPSCTAGLERLMQQMPVWEAIMHVIEAPGDCAEAESTVLGIPLAYWSLSGFVVVLIFCGEWLRRKKKVD